MEKSEIKDTGSLYKETKFGRFPVEPFNTYSNLIFLLFFVFWIIRIWGNWSQNIFLLVCLPFIFIAWVGGTMYHAKRNSKFWVQVDVYFIMIVAMLFTFYFWNKSEFFWVFSLLGIAPIIIGALIIRKSETLFALSLGYLIIGLFLLIPIIIFLIKNSFFGFWYILLAFAFSAIGLFLRSIDMKVRFMHGTHWLWHICGGIATNFLIVFIYISSNII